MKSKDLEISPGIAKKNLHPADLFALDRLSLAQPFWNRFVTISEHLDVPENVFLHAGPAFEAVEQICQPVLNSATVGAVFEGLAKDLDEGLEMIKEGEIILKPAQDHSVVTPLAAVVTPHMAMHHVYDGNHARSFCLTPINGGNGPAIRLGQKSNEAVKHLQWINGPVCEYLASGIAEGIELIPIASQSILNGDDCHGRTLSATALLLDEISRRTHEDAPNEEVVAFLRKSPSMFLNLWMAASKCILSVADGIEESSLITAMGGNGVSVGIQIAGIPAKWFTMPASPPVGDVLPEAGSSRSQGAIGDSAVVDATGLGAMTILNSPEQLKAFSNFLPVDYEKRISSLRAGLHLDFRNKNLPIGIMARDVVNYGAGPFISLGILDNAGELGRIGGGIFDPPLGVFTRAMSELESKVSESPT